MKTWLIYILFFWLQKINVVEGSSSEDEFFHAEDSKAIGVTTSTSASADKKNVSVSHIKSEKSHNAIDDAVPSTSNNQQCFFSCTEVPVNFCYEETSEELENFAVGNNMDLSTLYLVDTGNAALTGTETATVETDTSLNRNASFKRPSSCEFEDVFPVTSAKIRKSDTEVFNLVDTGDNLMSMLRSLSICDFSSDASDNEKDESSDSEDNSDDDDDKNESSAHSEFTQYWGDSLLVLQKKEFSKFFRMLKLAYSSMRFCSTINQFECTRGLHFIMQMLKYLKENAALVKFEANQLDFFQCIEKLHTYISGCDYSYDTRFRVRLLNSSSLCILCLFLMFTAIKECDYFYCNRKQIIDGKEKISSMDIYNCLIKCKDENDYESLCDTLMWCESMDKKFFRRPAFIYILLLDDIYYNDSFTDEMLLKLYNNTDALMKKCINTANLWISKPVTNFTHYENLLDDLEELKEDTENFHIFTLNFIRILHTDLLSIFLTEENITLYLLRWFSVVYMECISSLVDNSSDVLLSFYIFQKVFKECKYNRFFKDMERLDESVNDRSGNSLISVFIYVYTRICEGLVFSIIKMYTDLYNELTNLKIDVECNINEKKNLILEKVHSKISEDMMEYMKILKMLIIQRNKLYYIQTAKKLIDEIDSEVKQLKRYKLKFKEMLNNPYEINLESLCTSIKRNYEKLIKLLNEEDENEID